MNNIKKFEQFFESKTNTEEVIVKEETTTNEKKANLNSKKTSKKKEEKNEFVSIADKKKDLLKNRLNVEDKLRTKED